MGLFFSMHSCKTHSQSAVDISQLTKERWQEDLRSLSAIIKIKHKNAFHFCSEERFDKAVNDLNKQIPSLEPHQVLTGFVRISAMIGDGHTLVIPYRHFSYFPVLLFWFGNDLRIINTTAEYKDVLGCKIVKIDGMDIKEAAGKTDSLTPQNENKYLLLNYSQFWLRTADVLHALGITKQKTQAIFTVQDDAGNEKQILFKAVSSAQYKELKSGMLSAYSSVPAFITLNNYPIPSTDDPAPRYEIINNGKALCIYFYTYPADKNVLKEFSKNIRKEIEEKKINTLIIDVRQNAGGDFTKGYILIDELEKTGIHQTGKVYVITSRRTFSAAMCNAADFKKKLNATIVGEPPSNRPNGYSESGIYSLPHSKIMQVVSIKYYTYQEEDTPELKVDKLIVPDFILYKAGRDPVMEWILSNKY